MARVDPRLIAAVLATASQYREVVKPPSDKPTFTERRKAEEAKRRARKKGTDQ